MMMLDGLFAYIHYASAMLLAAFLCAEFMLLRKGATPLPVDLLGSLDYGVIASGVTALLSGALRAGLSSPKGALFYGGNLLLWMKLAVFFALAGASLVSSNRFARWQHRRRMDPYFEALPADVDAARRLVVVEMVLLAFLPMLAVGMSRGLAGWK